MTNADRRQIVATEIRKARREIAARNDGHLCGAQQSAALGLGRKRALAIIDAQHATGRKCIICGDTIIRREDGYYCVCGNR